MTRLMIASECGSSSVFKTVAEVIQDAEREVCVE